ncbi:hypothetical protein Bca4012_092627 [Brassica carinata]
MAPNKGTFLMICEQPVKSHFKGAEIVTFSEPWGKAAQATRHHIRVGKRAAGIHQGMPRFYHHFSIAKGSYFQPYWTHTSSWHSAMQKEVLNMGFASFSYSSLTYIIYASSLTDMPVAPHPVGSSLLGTLAPSSSSSSNDQPTKFHTSSSIKLKTTTNGGSETVAMKSLGLLYDRLCAPI